MKRKHLIRRVAEFAVSNDRPLHQDLEQVIAGLGAPQPHEATAISQAESGQIMPALSSVGVDPLVAQVMLLDPKSVVEAGRAVRRVPGSFVVAAPLAFPVVYVLLVLIAQLPVALIVMTKIATVLRDYGNEFAAGSKLADVLQPLSIILPLLAIVAGIAVLGVMGTRLGRRNFARWAYWSMKGVRTLRAAAIVTRNGVDPSRALAVLGSFGGWSANQLLELEGSQALDDKTLHALADQLYERAEARVTTLLTGLRIGITACLVVSAGTLLFSVYLRLAVVGLPLIGG